MFSKPKKLQDSSNEVYVKVLGEDVIVKFLNDNTEFKNEMPSDEYEVGIGNIPLYGLSTFSKNQIHICKSVKATKKEFNKIEACECDGTDEDCSQCNDLMDEKAYVIDTPTKLLLNVSLHELVHHYLDSLSREDLSGNEKLVELMANIIYKMMYVDQPMINIEKYIYNLRKDNL